MNDKTFSTEIYELAQEWELLPSEQERLLGFIASDVATIAKHLEYVGAKDRKTLNILIATQIAIKILFPVSSVAQYLRSPNKELAGKTALEESVTLTVYLPLVEFRYSLLIDLQIQS